MDLDMLYSDLPVYQKPGKGNYSYVKSVDVMDRMNKVFKGRWSSEVVFEQQTADCATVRVMVTVEDDGMNFHHEGYGSQQLFKQHMFDFGQAYKSAYSKALRDACRKFGIGLYLEEDVHEDEGVSAPTTAPVTKVPNIPVLPKKNGIPAPPLKIVTPPAPPISVTTKKAEENIEEAATVPLSDTEHKEDKVSDGSNVLKLPVMPAVPPRTNESKNGSKENKPPAFPSNVPAFQPNDDDFPISDVQKVALNGQLRLRKLEYNGLVTEAFKHHSIEVDEIPTIDNLTYKQAVNVISYANEVYKNK